MRAQANCSRNGSSLPPRLPSLSNVLNSLAIGNTQGLQYTIVGLSYRGYWTSRGRASQRGIEKDATAALQWIRDEFANGAQDVRVVLWGQSIGAGVATGAAAEYLNQPSASSHPVLPIEGIILETPFVSIRKMLAAMYPQRWVPYRYLWPFLRNWWDSEEALHRIANSPSGKKVPILLLPASRDEVVPSDQANSLEQLCEKLGLRVNRQDIAGAFHTEVMSKKDGRDAIAKFIRDVGQG